MYAVTEALRLQWDTEGYVSANSPVIGWHSAILSVEADSELPVSPASNLLNPLTAFGWQSDSVLTQYVTFTLGYDGLINYLAFVRHNLGSGRVKFSAEYEPADSPGTWVEIVPERFLSDDKVYMVRFEDISATRFRYKLVPDALLVIKPEIAVTHIGRVTQMYHGVSPGFTPLNFGIELEEYTSRSDRGDFSGRIILSETLKSSPSFVYLDPDWYREELKDFTDAAKSETFFFAWAPDDHPTEIGYAWLAQPAVPTINQIDGSFDLTLNMEGIEI